MIDRICGTAGARLTVRMAMARTIALRTVEGRWLAREVHVACSLAERCAGLLYRLHLGPQQGLLLCPARSIQTFGMRFSIDVVFLSAQLRVLGLAPCVPPWRVRVAPRGTARVLELPAGRIAATGLVPGMFVLAESAPAKRRIRSSCIARRASAAYARCHRLPIQFSLRLALERRCAPGSARRPQRRTP